jgi:hypothetical protein
MRKSKRIIFIPVLLVFICLLILFYPSKAKRYHSHINYDEVINAYIWHETKGNRILNNERIAEIVDLINKAKYLKDNDALNGPTPMCGGQISLKNGKRIGIIGCGDDLEIQRNDNSMNSTKAYFVHSNGYGEFFKRIIETGK